jgi:hypothetical protein
MCLFVYIQQLDVWNVVVKRLTLLFRIRQFHSSNLGKETGYPD